MEKHPRKASTSPTPAIINNRTQSGTELEVLLFALLAFSKKILGYFFHVPPTRRSTGYSVNRCSVNVLVLIVPSSIKTKTKGFVESTSQRSRLGSPTHLLRDSGQIVLTFGGLS